MNVDREELERLARFAEKVRRESWQMGARIGGHDFSERLLRLQEEAASVNVRLRDAYGVSDDGSPTRLPDVPLDLLNTPANRKLARLLRDAWEAAVEVDKERGHYPDGKADLIEDWVAQVEQECYGPAGHD